MAVSSLPELSPRVRFALAAGAAGLGALVALLLLDALVGLGGASGDVHRWVVTLAGIVTTISVAARVVALERERRAWIPLMLGLAAFTLGSILWSALWRGDPDPPVPAPSDVLWLAFYPAAYATIAMLLRRSFVRAPASMWLDGLLAGLTFAAAGIALLYGPVFTSSDRTPFDLGVQSIYSLGDLGFVVLVIGIVAMSGWRPGSRWLLIGGAMLCWFVADTILLGQVSRGATSPHGVCDLFWCAGLALLAITPWRPAVAPEGLRVEGVRVLLVPSGFGAIALGLLAYDRIVGLNGITAGLAIVAVAVALARTTLTLREVQLLADARHESLTDELTGLPSRRHFHRRLDTVRREAEAEDLPFGLLIFDLDRFKDLNDTLGHGAGDTLLQLVGRRLTDALGRSTLLARLGGDEFAVLLAPGNGEDASMRTAGKVLDAIAQPFEVEGLELDIGVSVGVAMYPDHATEDGELLRRADVAMYL
ncbi:MAG TPA: GGDEF domain-containing protein, partial [Conexibacter sp.]